MIHQNLTTITHDIHFPPTRLIFENTLINNEIKSCSFKVCMNTGIQNTKLSKGPLKDGRFNFENGSIKINPWLITLFHRMGIGIKHFYLHFWNQYHICGQFWSRNPHRNSLNNALFLKVASPRTVPFKYIKVHNDIYLYIFRI